MSDVTLCEIEVMERDSTLNPRQLRAAGFVPATLYSKGKDSESIQLRTHDLEMALRAGRRYYEFLGAYAGRAGNAVQFQLDPVSQDILSIEFSEISLKEAKAGASERAEELAAQEEELKRQEEEAKKALQKAAAAEAAEAEEAGDAPAEGAAEAPAAEASSEEEAAPVG